MKSGETETPLPLVSVPPIEDDELLKRVNKTRVSQASKNYYYYFFKGLIKVLKNNDKEQAREYYRIISDYQRKGVFPKTIKEEFKEELNALRKLLSKGKRRISKGKEVKALSKPRQYEITLFIKNRGAPQEVTVRDSLPDNFRIIRGEWAGIEGPQRLETTIRLAKGEEKEIKYVVEGNDNARISDLQLTG